MDSRSSVKKEPQELYLDALPRAARRAFLYCITLPFLGTSRWYLAGGTALALQIGHRQSIDLDFFIPQSRFQENRLERQLFSTGVWKTSFRQEGTLYGLLHNAKMSFIAYPFFHPSTYIRCGTIRILSPADIASMKIVAIGQRGRKRDFVDLYWYCNHREPLADVIRRAVTQYPGQVQNTYYYLKSLVYFVDAEEDPMPKLFFSAHWRSIKKYFREEVRRLTKQSLHLE